MTGTLMASLRDVVFRQFVLGGHNYTNSCSAVVWGFFRSAVELIQIQESSGNTYYLRTMDIKRISLTQGFFMSTLQWKL